MSFRPPSQVSPTTGSDQNVSAVRHGADRLGDERVVNHPDAVRVRDPDDAAELPRLADPLEPGELAVAVQSMTAREHRLRPRVAVVRDDDRDAGPHRPATDVELALSLDEGRVPDADARDVRDGVVDARTSASDDDAEIARSHPGMLAAFPAPGGDVPASGRIIPP